MTKSCVMLWVCLFAVVVTSHKGYQKLIPNGENVPNWPAVGHVEPSVTSNRARNPFGVDFKNENFKWTVNLCRMDSDNDGRTNGEELGDPDCVWKEGSTPSRSRDLSNPGIPDNFNKSSSNSSPTAKKKTGSPVASKADPTTTESAADDDETDAPSVDSVVVAEDTTPAWIHAHAFFMIVSFGLITPFATLIPFYCRSLRTGAWREDHIRVMTVSNAIGFLGFLIAVVSMGVKSTFHGIVGVFLMTLTVLQAFGGFARFRFPSRDSWKNMHSIAGRTIAFVVPFQLFFGYFELSKFMGSFASLVGFAHFIVMMTNFIVLNRAVRKRNASSQQDSIGNYEDVPVRGFAAIPQTTVELS